MFEFNKKKLDIEQFKRLQKQLQSFLNEAGDRIEFATHKAVENIKNRASNMIQAGGRTGHVYEWEVDLPGKKGDEHGPGFIGWWKAPNGRWLPLKLRWKPHTASAPGEPPRADKGGLDDSLAYGLISKAPHPVGEVGSTINYGLFLETGTRYMDARPYLEPSSEEEVPLYIEAIENALEQARKKAAKLQ